jgi:glycine hydroxymethyltransferase
MSAALNLSDIRAAGFFTSTLAQSDPDLAKSISDELHRQQTQIELIASENIVSRAVLEAQGSVLTNKYAEGYPGKRYYQGCHYVDVAEQLAIDRAKRLFNCAYVNVQPHSGAQANGAVMLALTKPGDTILGMSLDAGGHLTHGAKAAQSGKWYNAIQYGVRADTHLIDYDEVERLAVEPIRARSISPASAKLRTRLVPFCMLIWRILPVSLQAACIRRRCRMPMSSPPRRIKHCAARVAA